MLKGKLGAPEVRVNRLMNRSVSCTVKNPKGEVFGYAPSTQAGVAPFNILVGANPASGLTLLSLPFSYPQPRGIGAGGTSPVWPCPPGRVLGAPGAFGGSRCGRGRVGKG